LKRNTEFFKEIVMKQKVLFAAIVLLAATALVQAQDELHGSIDVTYQSKYVWRGFDIYGDKSAIQPSLNLDLYGTGFGIGVTGHRANSDKYENGERWDYSVNYRNALFGGESYLTQYMIGWVSYNYPDHSRKFADIQEAFAALSWPEILPVEGLVPTYVLVKLWPTGSSTVVGSGSPSTGTASGFAHIFMLDYGLSIEDLIPDMPEQILKLHSEVVFNDGVGPGGQNIDHDWSNVVFGVATDFDLAENVVLTPAVYYQVTMDKSVNTDQDELWCTLGMKYSF
jgi:hypothetical protein